MNKFAKILIGTGLSIGFLGTGFAIAMPIKDFNATKNIVTGIEMIEKSEADKALEEQKKELEDYYQNQADEGYELQDVEMPSDLKGRDTRSTKINNTKILFWNYDGKILYLFNKDAQKFIKLHENGGINEIFKKHVSLADFNT